MAASNFEDLDICTSAGILQSQMFLKMISNSVQIQHIFLTKLTRHVF